MSIPGQLAAAASLSTAPETERALEEALVPVLQEIGGTPDLLVVFMTPHHAAAAERVRDRLRQRVRPDVFVGTTASGVIGGGREVEKGPGFALWAARMPGSRVQAFHLGFEALDSGGVVRGWPDVGSEGSAVLFADPFSFPLDPFLDSLRRGKRTPHLVGGVASGGLRPGENRLFMDEEIHREGVVGFVVDRGVALEPILSQGCRPIGQTFTITRCERNVIFELDHAPASAELSELLRGLDDEEARRFKQAPQLGLKRVTAAGDLGGDSFLIRGVTGIDPDSGAVAVGDQVQDGLEVRFYARDGGSAHRDWESVMSLASSLYPRTAGALLFSCTGRGRRLFGEEGHDARVIRKYYPGLPLAGMFAAGEIGSVCGQPYIHGFSASMGLLVAQGS